MKRSICILITVLLPVIGFSQTDSTTTVLSFDRYMKIVQEHHPIAQQAQLLLKQGEAEVLRARGAFDPKAFSDGSQKYFDGNQYYSVINSGLKIPTWFGVEVKAGYEQNQGVFLNPENKTPAAGLWFAGVSLPVGQGFLIDKRRTALQKARVFQNMTEAERLLALNELLFNAGNTYWKWFSAYHNLKVYENALELAQQRFSAVKRSTELDDRPFIDTLEAGIQLQNRTLLLQQAQLEFANTSAALSVYLWANGTVPLELDDNTQPPRLEEVEAVQVDPTYLSQIDSLNRLHPELQRYGFKINQLEIDRRLKQEQLKPTLNLNYNPLTEPQNGDLMTNYSVNNYKWGFEFSMPVFLRKERGELRLADLEIQEAQLEMKVKQATILYKANASLNQWATSITQVNLYTQTVQDYLGLLKGEQQMFSAGESSVFMVNSRELGYINAQVKLIELLTKNQMSSLATGYAFGQLNKR